MCKLLYNNIYRYTFFLSMHVLCWAISFILKDNYLIIRKMFLCVQIKIPDHGTLLCHKKRENKEISLLLE